jgi:hypothetical protein
MKKFVGMEVKFHTLLTSALPNVVAELLPFLLQIWKISG